MLARVLLHVLARVLLHVLVPTVYCYVLARVVKHVLARVLLHVLARVLLHVLAYYSKTCIRGVFKGGPGTHNEAEERLEKIFEHLEKHLIRWLLSSVGVKDKRSEKKREL